MGKVQLQSLIPFLCIGLLGSVGTIAQSESVELEIEFFHDCTIGDEGLVCKIPEDATTPTVLKSLNQFQKPVSVGWIPSLGVFVVVDQESEVTVGKAATSALPSPKPIAFYKLNIDKTALLPTDVQTEIKNVQSQVTTAAITPGQMNFQVQYQLGQNAEQNKKNTDLSTIIIQQQPHTYAQADDFLANNSPPSATTNAPPQIVVGYDYDAMNRMVGRQTQDGPDTTSTQWAYFDLMRTVEYNNNRPLSQLEFFHGANGIDYLIPKSPQDAAGQITPAKGLALHKDTLGSPAVVTNEDTGDLVERNYFSPFGDTIVRNNAADYPVSKLGNPILYTGQYYDATAELYLFPYRAYDPQTGKFLQRDPTGFADGPNPTTYVGNSPYSFVDPLGLAKKSGNDHEQELEDLRQGCIGCAPDASLVAKLLGAVTNPQYAQNRGVDPIANLYGRFRKQAQSDIYRNLPNNGEGLPIAFDFILPTSTFDVFVGTATILLGKSGNIVSGLRQAEARAFTKVFYRNPGAREVAELFYRGDFEGGKALLREQGVRITEGGAGPKVGKGEALGMFMGNRAGKSLRIFDKGLEQIASGNRSLLLHELKHYDDFLTRPDWYNRYGSSVGIYNPAERTPYAISTLTTDLANTRSVGMNLRGLWKSALMTQNAADAQLAAQAAARANRVRTTRMPIRRSGPVQP